MRLKGTSSAVQGVDSLSNLSKGAENWASDRDCRCLQIQLQSGETYILPYQHFLGACYLEGGRANTLKIEFTGYSVVIEGGRLREIAVALGEMSLSYMRELPARYQKLETASEAFSIRVTALTA
jgi:hypothetical protein